MTKVVIADDHALVRNGLRSLLEAEGIKVIAESSDGNDAVRRCAEFQPDIAVIDIAMPKLNGIEAARRIQVESPQTRVIILSMHAEEEYVNAALRAGVRGYVLKQEAFTQLLSAIQSVKAGGVFISPVLAKKGLSDYCRLSQGNSDSFSAIEKISGRERQILQLIAEGNSNAEVARDLHISIRTVESHRAKIMEKLGIFTTAGLTRFAIRHGISSLES